MSNLKNYRENELKWYILAYLLLVVGVANPQLLQVTDVDWISKIEKLVLSALISGVIATLSFVFDSIFSNTTKDVLIYLGFTKRPGSTMFSRIKKGKTIDNRFDTAVAKVKYKSIIDGIATAEKKKIYENSNWYSIYYKHKSDVSVESTHRDYLLCRDLYITTVSMLLLTGAVMATCLIAFSWILIGYLLIMLFCLNIATHIKAHRFTNTVIAIDIAK